MPSRARYVRYNRYAFDPLIRKVRPHAGQVAVAARVRSLLQPEAPSELFQSHKYTGKVQDAYSLRCVPQVHGICHDTIRFVKSVLEVELNSATDNPMVFTQVTDVTYVTVVTFVTIPWSSRR